MTRRVFSLALVALLLLTLSGSISADDPAPAEIEWIRSDDHSIRFVWYDGDGNFILYWLDAMRVYPNDRNGNQLVRAYGTIDYETYATIEEACELFQGPPLSIEDPCNKQRNGSMTLTGVSTCRPCMRADGPPTYNWTAVFTPSGNVRVHCHFTPGSEVLPQQCID
jgi:hypothetical protein